MQSLQILALLIVLFASAFCGVHADIISDMICLVNTIRAKAGVPALALSSALINAAEDQADYQQSLSILSHVGRGGSSPDERINDQGYRGVSSAENIAVGQKSVSSVMNTWMNSAGHADNILNPDFTDFGCAVAYDASGSAYWVQTFGGDGKSHNYPTCPGSSNILRGAAALIEVL